MLLIVVIHGVNENTKESLEESYTHQKHSTTCTCVLFFYIPLTNRVRGLYRKLRTEFFPPRFMARALRAWAIDRRGKIEDP